MATARCLIKDFASSTEYWAIRANVVIGIKSRSSRTLIRYALPIRASKGVVLSTLQAAIGSTVQTVRSTSDIWWILDTDGIIF